VTEPDAVWVRSLHTGAGGYRCAISLGEGDGDILCWLTPDRAVRYATTLAAHIAAARHDAMVAAQLRHIDADHTDVHAAVITQLRADRPKPDDTATSPLTYVPGVSMFTGAPFLHVYRGGKPAWQWTLAVAISHMSAVLTIAHGAPLDAAYRRLLIADVGATASMALDIVDDLASFRHPDDTD
jgi:hypothetical protein